MKVTETRMLWSICSMTNLDRVTKKIYNKKFRSNGRSQNNYTENRLK